MAKCDKQVYFQRSWNPGVLISQQGVVVTVEIPDLKIELDVPYTHVRDACPTCLGCHIRIFYNSYQTHEGTSYCVNCYRNLDETAINLMFDGPQWLSWDGQLSIRDMDDSHIANTLGMLKRNANHAAEVAGGKPEQYLHHNFNHLVRELHRRRPPEDQIKANSFMLYVWSVLYMMFGRALMEKKDS